MNAERQLEELAVAVHGVLAALHFLGFIYNARRRNVFDSLVHAAGAIYDANAVRIHITSLR